MAGAARNPSKGERNFIDLTNTYILRIEKDTGTISRINLSKEEALNKYGEFGRATERGSNTDYIEIEGFTDFYKKEPVKAFVKFEHIVEFTIRQAVSDDLP